MLSSNRRTFVGTALTSLGALVFGRARAAWAQSQGSAEARLKELGITLPDPPSPVATYVPAVRVGNLLFVSGHGPGPAPDGKSYAGKVGRDLTLEEGRAAARSVGLNVLASTRSALGSLDKVVRTVKTLGMVNAVDDFTQQPQVVNGFSDLLVEIFGEERGKGARSAVGMGSLPSNIPVEVEVIFEVRD
jgi:enamine deaminase RidA (YjgF/YER057c/UK114 family)